MRVIENIEAWGHFNISAKNETTFEVTKENYLTTKGDCIIAVHANKGARDLNDEFKRLARSNKAHITVVVKAGNFKEVTVGWGDPRLTFDHATDLVARKSDYICNRTLMIKSNKAAINFSRDLIMKIKRPSERIMMTLIVEI